MSSAIQLLYLLSPGKTSAAENMAMDWLMLESFPEPQAARLRFYSWVRPSFTFGYRQKWIEARTASDAMASLIRRPTGGGLVDHRQDWTYALVLPAEHPLAQVRACESYRAVHEALLEALKEQGVGCKLQVTGCKSTAQDLAVCFEQAETFDIVCADDERKIAGAAQKRTRKGLLFQGSVNRIAAKEVNDWDNMGESFAQRLAVELGCRLKQQTPPICKEAIWGKTVAQFASREWNEKR